MAEFDPTRAKPETVRELVEIFLRSHHAYLNTGQVQLRDRLREECRIPLRTRAEIDAEIATIIRDYHRHITRPGWKEQPDWDSFSTGIKNDLNRLCAEPTSDSGPSSVDAGDGGIPPPAVPVSPAGADLLPWRVGRQVGRTIYDAGNELIGVMDTPGDARRVVDAVNASGPPGAAAAKESSDTTAAAPEGAALKGECDACGAIAVLHRAPLRDGNSHKRLCLDCLNRIADAYARTERECNCEQSLALKREYERQSKLSADLLRERGETILELMLFRNGKKEPAAALDAIALIVGACGR